MVGLSIAHQLLERGITSSISILDKEPELGLHSSGRNSRSACRPLLQTRLT